MMDARDVIAVEIESLFSVYDPVACADDILAALDNAGFRVIRTSQILVDAFGEPDAIEEVRPGVMKYTWDDGTEDDKP